MSATMFYSICESQKMQEVVEYRHQVSELRMSLCIWILQTDKVCCGFVATFTPSGHIFTASLNKSGMNVFWLNLKPVCFINPQQIRLLTY